MSAQCHQPIWRYDDFTLCFRRQYLQIILPLILCGLSLLHISIDLTRRFIRKRRQAGYKPLANGHNVFGVRGSFDEQERSDDEATEDDDEGLAERRLSLQPTRTHDSVVNLDRPTGQITLVVVEELAVLAEVIICVVTLVSGALGHHGTWTAVAALVTWSYIAILTSARLLLAGARRLSYSKLWYHTAILYGFQWIFTAIIFRSAIIHPRSGLTQGLTCTKFALATLLLGFALTTRMGNKTLQVEYEDGLEPSREPLASLFSIATFSWADPIVWKGYKKTIDLQEIWNLAPEDKTATVLQNYRQLVKTNALAWHLLKYFRHLLVVQAIWAVFSSAFTFAPTLLLKLILEYVEDPSQTPANAAWLYVILLFVCSCVQAVGDGQALWIGRKVCIRLRAIIIGEIYAKALRRKAAAGNEEVSPASTAEETETNQSLIKRVMSFGRKKKTVPEVAPQVSKDSKDSSESQANVGTIINLMAVDSFKVSEITAYLHFLWASVPVQIIIAVTLLYQFLGLSSIAGILAMVILLPINLIIAKQFTKAQKKIMAATDARIHTTNEVLQNIRIIKFFAWENRFGNIVNEKRTTELRALRNRYILWSFAATIWYGAPILITFFSFLIYTVIEGKPLIPSVAFTSLSLFSILRIPLDQLADMVAHVQESKVSVDRIEEFLNEEDTGKYSQLRHDHFDEDGQPRIGFDRATFSWASKKAAGDEGSSAFRMIDLDVKFPVGQLSIVAGPTGSGKTSLLMALLGEMTLMKGSVYLPGGHSREDLRRDPYTGLTESVAYCAQQAWLVNDNIKQNIVFANPWDEDRYKAVIKACALERDLEILDAGDETLVGEKGIALSGGQKQRISLARAIYSHSRHILLDDCLSAVDSHTAKWIFEQCLMGPLMLNRTCILVTHNVALCAPQSKHVVVLDNGKITHQGTAEEVIASGALGEDLLMSRPGSTGGSKMPSRVPSGSDIAEEGKSTANGDANGKATTTKTSSDKKATTDHRTETIAKGGVKWKVIGLYLRAMGPWYFWLAAAFVFAAQQLGSVANNIWIREWANSYHTESINAMSSTGSYPVNYVRGNSLSFSTSCLSTGTCAWNIPSFFKEQSASLFKVNSQTAMTNGNPFHVDVKYYLGVYAVLGLTYMLISLLREGILFGGSLAASWKIHERLLAAVTRAQFKFFDSTPLGQLMNRFSKDIEALDQEVAPIALGMIHCLVSVITVVILISIITPGFLIAGIFISAIYYVIGMFYISSSRDLKRIESVQRSPLYQQFGETLSGVTTIRAYGDERRFMRDNLDRINAHNRPFIYLWATNRWLALRVDIAGALVSFFAGAFVIMSVGKIDAGAAGLSLTYAVTFTENVLWLVRLYAVNEQNMNSVERIKEYLDVEQEAKAIIPETEPLGNWPRHGSIEFIGYTTRYRADLEPVLKEVSFKVLPGEKVGIVGRTGAGKSSLALALFRGLEAEEGKILIDDVDIGQIGLQTLRESITIVPQDPTLFTGTIRNNLDPFNLFTDEEIFTALRRVHLIGESFTTTPRTSTPEPGTSGTETPSNKNIFLNLSSPVSESGSNLSQGQRQLLCLARAMLKNPKVLLMDEATASIDYATDSKIQETIRELKSTIITIAHRLQTIIDYDKVLVLEKGRIVEFGDPWTLIQWESGTFRGMCEMSGDLENLEQEAKKAADGKKLVDV